MGLVLKRLQRRLAESVLFGERRYGSTTRPRRHEQHDCTSQSSEPFHDSYASRQVRNESSSSYAVLCLLPSFLAVGGCAIRWPRARPTCVDCRQRFPYYPAASAASNPAPRAGWPESSDFG